VSGSLVWGGEDLRSLFVCTSTTMHVIQTLVGPAPIPFSVPERDPVTSTEERLRRLEDVEEIRRLIQDYRRHLDAPPGLLRPAVRRRRRVDRGTATASPGGITEMLTSASPPPARPQSSWHLLTDR